jgi:putative permease
VDNLKAWLHRSFSDPQVVILGGFLVVAALVIFGLGNMLAPVFTSLVFAYLLEAVVARLERLGLPRTPAVILVFLLFMGLLVFLLLVLVPMLARQLTQLVQQFPNYISQGQALLQELPTRYPRVITEAQLLTVFDDLSKELGRVGQRLLSLSLASPTDPATPRHRPTPPRRAAPRPWTSNPHPGHHDAAQWFRDELAKVEHLIILVETHPRRTTHPDEE